MTDNPSELHTSTSIRDRTREKLQSEAELAQMNEQWIPPQIYYQYYGEKGNYPLTQTLKDFLPKEAKSFTEHVLSRPPTKRKVLEIMGPKNNLIPISSETDPGIFITLVDTRKPTEKIADQAHGIHGIEADFYNPNTLNTLQNKMKELSVKTFDIIVCRPLGPFSEDYLKEKKGYRTVYLEKLFQYLNFLSPDGELYTQIPHYILNNDQEDPGKNISRFVSLMEKQGYLAEVAHAKTPEPSNEDFLVLKVTHKSII